MSSTPIKDALAGVGGGENVLPSETAATAVVFEQLFGVQPIAATRGDANGTAIVAVPKGIELKSLKPLLDEYLEMKPRLTVVVRLSPEPIDFDAWCARYVRLILDADAAAQKRQQEAA